MLGSLEAENDEAFESLSIQTFQPSSYFIDN